MKSEIRKEVWLEEFRDRWGKENSKNGGPTWKKYL